jgi:hypothetical protein
VKYFVSKKEKRLYQNDTSFFIKSKPSKTNGDFKKLEAKANHQTLDFQANLQRTSNEY